MKVNKLNLKSGSLKICEYKPSDKHMGNRIKSVVGDIYTKTDFDKSIIWIFKVFTKDNHSIEDVIKEYIDTEWAKNTLLFAQAGTLALIPEAGNIVDGLEGIKAEKEHLYKAEFYNIIFNRLASRSYGNNDIFIYLDDFSDAEFIKKYIGTEEENKLINRIR